jgi:hypothetical protein
VPQPSTLLRNTAPHGGVRQFGALALLLAVLVSADIWLLIQFAAAAAMLLAERNTLLIAMLAAFGRGIMAAGAVVLTWLVVEYLRDTLRSNVSAGKHNFYTQ